MKEDNMIKLSLIISTIIFVFLISQSGFKNGVPTCNNYIVNVYLYLALSICLLGVLAYQIPWEGMKISPFIYIIFSFVFIIALSIQPSFQDTMSQVVFSHMFWFLFILTISATFWVFLKAPIYKEYLLSTVLIVALIFIIMSGIVYMYPEFFKSTYGFAMGSLLLILILIIIFELSMYFFSKGYAFSQTHRTVSYVVIVVFSLLVSYDTSRIFMLADRCVNYPNYPKSSITFFLDVINLFARIISLRSR
jgi:Integral membrane protein, interacts with FtsH